MTRYDIFRVTCKDGQAFDHVWAHMTGQGVVYVRRDEDLIATLGPHSACTIERIEGLSVPVHAGSPEALLWVFGCLFALLAIAMAVAACLMQHGAMCGAPMPMPPIPPPAPLPMDRP